MIAALILAASLYVSSPREVALSVFDAALLHHEDPWLMLALGKHESDYNARAISSVGAFGYWQLMPQWWGAHPLRMCRLRPSECTWFQAYYAAAALGHYRKKCGGPARAVTGYRFGYCREPRGIDVAVVRTRNRLKRRFGGVL